MSKYVKVDDIKNVFGGMFIVSTRREAEEVARFLKEMQQRIDNLPTIEIPPVMLITEKETDK